MTPEYKAAVAASKQALLEKATQAMQALEDALVIAIGAGQTDSEMSPLYKALAATLAVKIKARNEVAA